MLILAATASVMGADATQSSSTQAKASVVAQSKLNSAEKAVADANAKVASAEAALKAAESALKAEKSAKKPDAKAISDAKAKVKASEAALDAAEDAVKPLEKAVRKAKDELKAAKKADEKAAAKAAKAKAEADKLAKEKALAKAKAEAKAKAAKAEAEKLAKEKAKFDAEKNKLVAERKPAVDAAAKVVAGKKADLATAESNLKAAEAALKSAKSAKKPDAKAIAAAKAKVDASEKALDVAEEALEKAEKSLRIAKKSLDAVEGDARDNLAALEKKARAEKQKAKDKNRLDRENAEAKLAKARVEFDRAESDLDKAELDYRRARSAQTGSLKKAVDSAKANYETAKTAADASKKAVLDADAKVVTAEKALDAAKKSKNANAVAKAKSDLESAEKALKSAKLDAKVKAKLLDDKADILSAAKAKLPSKVIDAKAAEVSYKAAESRFATARKDLIAAQDKWYSLNPKRVNLDTMNMSLKEAQAKLKAAVPSYEFVGDVVWLASTYINGLPLYGYFRNQIITDAVENARRDAIEGGFYFAGFADADTKGPVTGSTKKILVDKGRVGTINVSYVDEAGSKLDPKGAYYSQKQIKHKLGQNRVSPGASEGKVFNFNSISDRFYELNGNPDIAKANLAFKPGIFDYKYEDGSIGDKHALTMDVEVQEEKVPLHAVIGVDNFGSVEGDDASFGTADLWMARLTAQYLNLWQADHILTFNGTASLGGSLWGGAGSYMIPRLDNGKWWDWTWTLHGGYTDVSEEDVVPLIDVEGSGYFYGIQASKRLLDTGRSTLDLSLGVTFRDIESAVIIDGSKFEYGRDTNGDGEVDDKGYEIIPASIALMYSETALDSFGGRNYATLEGVYNLGGSDIEQLQYIRYAIDEDNYWLARLQLARIQLLGDYGAKDAQALPMLFVKADAQYADTAIVGAEQFSIGGHSSIRGYKERQFLGDTGVSGTIELRSPIIVGLFDRTPEGGKKALDRLQFVAFLDAGYYTLEQGKGTEEDDSEFLMGAGFGLRAALGEWSQLRCDLGFPLITDDENYDTDSCRLYLSLQFQW